MFPTEQIEQMLKSSIVKPPFYYVIPSMQIGRDVDVVKRHAQTRAEKIYIFNSAFGESC